MANALDRDSTVAEHGQQQIRGNTHNVPAQCQRLAGVTLRTALTSPHTSLMHCNLPHHALENTKGPSGTLGLLRGGLVRIHLDQMQTSGFAPL